MENLLLGMSVALTPTNLLFCFVGALLGTVVGILPGLGPMTTITILLPLTFKMDVTSAIIMLSGIFYGVAYGGTATSVLLRIPGEASSIVTCLDGYEMARKGRAGPALAIAAIGSFVAGTAGVVAISYFAPPLAELVFAFGPAEYAMLMVLGLAAVTYFSSNSIFTALLLAGFGILLGCVGSDPMTMEPRLTFGLLALSGGLDLVPVAIGLFGVSELLLMARRPAEQVRMIAAPKGLLGFMPSKEEARRSVAPVARGTVLGFLIGVLPGGGGFLASFLSYALERKLSKRPQEFGQGAVEGLAGPESANNSGTTGAFMPLLCMGIPSSATTAILLSAFMIHGVAPGPAMILNQPQVFWGVVASMYVGNLMLLVLNLPLIGLLVRVLEVPRAYLSPLIFLLCLVGVYSSDGTGTSLVVAVVFGFVGYFLRRSGYDLSIVILGMVLGPIIERSVRQSLSISSGDLSILVSSPISITLTVVTLLFLAVGALGKRTAAAAD